MNKSNSRYSTNELVKISLLAALAFASTLLLSIKFFNFLTYEPKDVIIMLAGMTFGPLVTIIIAFVVSFIEMITISADGILGMIMNILSSVAFVTTATTIYYRKRNMTSLIIGLIVGSLMTTLIMVGWNYLITPIYLQIPRAEVLLLIKSAIIPFNLIKSGINTLLIILLYNPVSRLLDENRSKNVEKNSRFAILVLSTMLIVSIIIILVMLP